MSREVKAWLAYFDGEDLIRGGHYAKAKAKIQEAINLYPTIWHGQELITLSEILHLSKKPKRSRINTWPFTLLQIPTSSTESEVNSRYERLSTDLNSLYFGHKIKGTAAAIHELTFAMSMYKEKYVNHDNHKKRNASCQETATSDYSFSGGDTDDEKDTADADDRDDNTYAARSTPGFKKLRQHVFATLPQQPHFSPLAEYSASARQETRVGFDMIFVKLTQKLQKLDGNQILSNEEEDAIRGEFSDLVRMGYDVMKLRERFDMLVRVKTLANEDESYAEKRKNLEGEIRAVMVHLENDQHRLSRLTSENEMVKTEMANLKAKLSKGDLCNMVEMDAKDN